MKPFVFPKWTNGLRTALAIGAGFGLVYVVLLFLYGAGPTALAVGYQPVQPIPYSHAIHAGKLGMDCRYCHNTVEQSAHASIPPTQTCMNCHANIRPTSEKLVRLRDSYTNGYPVEWVRVHDLPDYAYFNHSAHVTRGVGCVSCHGRVDKMGEEGVWQVERLSMSWCLECHRNPEPNLRPLDRITDMDWQPMEDPVALGKRLREQYNINPSTDCSTCHR